MGCLSSKRKKNTDGNQSKYKGNSLDTNQENIVPLPDIDSAAELSNLLDKAGNKLVVLDFYAPWCMPCKLMAPVLQSLQAQYPEVKFAKIDVDLHEDLGIDYGIRAMPTVCYIKNNQLIDETFGFNAEQVRVVLERLSGKPNSSYTSKQKS